MTYHERLQEPCIRSAQLGRGLEFLFQCTHICFDWLGDMLCVVLSRLQENSGGAVFLEQPGIG